MRFVKSLCAATATFAATIGTGAAEDEIELVKATPAMWRAADADTEIFLLGTFHILPKGVDWRTGAFEEAFEKANTIYFEVETDAPDTQTKTVGVVMTEGFNADGKKLTDILNAEDGAKMHEIVGSLGLPFEGVNAMRPWYAFLTLSVQFIVNQGFDPGSGVESILVAEARTKGKDLRFFETLEQQLALFTGLKPKTEQALLELTIRDWEEQAESFDDLFAAWRGGDTAFIDTEMNKIMAEQSPAVFNRLIVERNEAWTDEIATIMKNETGTIFVAVGAAHLVGDQSVPAMLDARGIKVTRYGEEPVSAQGVKAGGEDDADFEAANDNAAPADDSASEEDAIGAILKEAAGDQ